MLHGCTQSPDDFAAGTRMNQLAEERGLVIGEGSPRSRCWSPALNQFQHFEQFAEAGCSGYVIAGITREVLRDHRLDPARVYVAGLSSGGAAAATMASTYPDLYAAVGVHSGLAHGAASDVMSAFSAMSRGGRPGSGRASPAPRVDLVPTIVFHGDRDTTVHPSNADHVLAQARAGAPGPLAATIERGQAPGGLAYTRTVYAAAGHGEHHPLLEQWVVHGAGHAWSGGSSAGSYTEPRGPDAGREMLRFFLAQRHPTAR